MRTTLARIGAALCLCACLVPSSAAAAEASDTLEVQLWLGAEPGRTVIVVGQTLPPATPLPTTVRLPIPPGAQVVWAGEIAAAGTGAQDPQREVDIVPGTGGDVAEFTATDFRNVQIEAIGGALQQQGDQVTARQQWVQSEPATVTAFSVRVPPGATDVQITPPSSGPPDTNEVGEKLYALPLQQLSPGDAVEIAVTYRQGSSAGAVPSGGGSSPLLPWLVGAFVVAAGILAFVLLGQRGGRAEGDESTEAASLEAEDVGADGDRSSTPTTDDESATPSVADDDDTFFVEE